MQRFFKSFVYYCTLLFNQTKKQMRKLFSLLAGFVLFIGAVQAQNRTIAGKVTDEKGAGIAGVTVSVKGSTSGTTTGSDGSYSFSAPSSAKTLVFSSVNFSTREQNIGSTNSVSVSLVAKDDALSEVVVTSFGIRRDKKTLGYSTPTISSEEITQVRNSNISNALVGKVAGVRTQGTGGSFTGSSVLIRGYTSVTGSSAPLYVVDGMPIDNGGGGTALQNGATSSNRVLDINPDDVEEMTVLKGAAATSLYGSRGAAGVILITTKKGKKKTKNSVEINTSYNIVQVNRLPEYQNEYAQGANGAYLNANASSWGPKMVGQTVTNFFGNPEVLMPYPNNVKDFFQNGYNLQNSVAFSGGSDKTTFRVSYNNTRETYVVRTNELSKNVLTANLNSDVSDKLQISTFVSINNTQSNRSQQGNQLSNPLFRTWMMPRSYNLTGNPYYRPNGDQWYYGADDNPYWALENVRFNDEVNRFFGNVGLNYKFNNWLNANLKVGGDVQSFKAHGYDEIGTRGGGNTNSQTTGGIIDSRNYSRSWNSYFTLNAQKQFGKFNISGTLGNEIVDNYSQSLSVRSTGLSIRGFDHISNATVLNIPSVGTSRARTIGAFGDLNIEYDRWLSLNVKARNDWSSSLPMGARSIFYPAVALSAVITDAVPSLKSNVLSFWKMRANYGVVGRAAPIYNTDNYAGVGGAADGFGPNIAYPFNGLSGYTISNAAGNVKLKPEFTTEWEIGTDMRLWNDRIKLEVNYYERKLTEGLFSVPASAASGVTSVFQNAGEIETKGWEVAIGITPIRSKNFSWNINANYTQFRSIVTKLAPGVGVITLAGFTTPNIRLMVGEDYGVMFGNAYQRHANGKMILNTTTGLPIPTSGVIKLGNTVPIYTMGITNTFTYKMFTLDVLFDIRNGGDMYSRNLADLHRNGVSIESAALPRFDKDNITPLTNYKFDGVDATGNPVNVPLRAEQYWGNQGKYVAAEGFMVNTSWFRVRELNLTMRLPQSVVDKTPFGAIEFGLFGRNLFLSSPGYPHLDPEQNALGSSNIQGLEFNANPSTRTFGCNLRLTL